jgi:hypothetical protein
MNVPILREPARANQHRPFQRRGRRREGHSEGQRHGGAGAIAMSRNQILALTISLLASSPAWALQADQHQSHHPDTPLASTPASAAQSAAAAQHVDHEASAATPAVDAQIDAMHAMHEKMMAAKSPAERKALTAEHERMMRDGMKMMAGMSNKEGAAGGCDMGERERHMAEHMEMMQAMMQMMMDRMDSAH